MCTPLTSLATLAAPFKAGVTSTAKVTLMPFSALGRGLGAAGSAIGSAASRITAFSGSDGDRPRSPERRSSRRGSRSSSSNSKKGADDDDKSIFATSLANLSPEELEALGLRFGVNRRPRTHYIIQSLWHRRSAGAVRAIATQVLLTHPGVACTVVRGICAGRRRGRWGERDRR